VPQVSLLPPFLATYCLPYQYEGRTQAGQTRSRVGKARSRVGKTLWANVLQGGRTVSLLSRRPPAHLVGLVNVELKSWKFTAIY
jgi:hypothetical protein